MADLRAGPRDLLRLVYRHSARLIVIGLAAGIGGALWLTRLLQSQLDGVAPNDPATFVVAAPILTLVALAACWLPAWRASRVEPTVVLRDE